MDCHAKERETVGFGRGWLDVADEEGRMKVLMVTGNGRLLDGINRHVLMVAGGLQARGIEVAGD